MDPEQYQIIKRVVMQALETPSDERSAFLDDACGDDAGLRDEVEQLLAMDVGQSFLAHSPVALSADGPLNDEPLEGKIGRIRIQSLIARGGMGEVYAGVDDLLERSVAIKVMSSGSRMSAARRSAFLNEARILSSLKHPNICQVYDFFEDRDRDVLVLELIEGQTLRELMDQGRVEQPLQIARQVAHALAAAHERGVVHRDLKPENLMITLSGEIKVLDFGLAGAVAARSDDPGPLSDKPISGTPGYMSPEQARGEATTSSTDMFTFGVLLAELLTGIRPFSDTDSAPQLIERARQGQVNAPTTLPGPETALIQHLLSAKPDARPSARDALGRIDHILGRSHRRLGAIAAGVLLCLALLAGWKYTTDLKHEQTLAIEAREQAEAARAEAEDLIGFMLDDLNSGLRQVGRLELLESVADQAFAYYGDMTPQQMSRSTGQPAVALQRVAEVIDSQGDLKRAVSIMQRSISGLEHLVAIEPANELAWFRLGTAQTYMADLLRTNGNFAKAREHSAAAMAIGHQLTQGLKPGTGPDHRPNAEERWRVLLRSTYIHADTYMRVGDNERTVEYLEQAVALAIPAAEAEPGLRSQLADIQFKRCETYYDTKLDELALEACLATLEMDRQLHLGNPDDYWAHKNFALDHQVVARVYRSLGKPAEGLAMVEAGSSHTQQLLQWEPDNVTRKNDHITSIVTKGQMLKAMGDVEASMAAFDEAYALVTSMTGERDDIPFLNNAFLTRLYVGEIDEARKTAHILAERGFKRREFREMCVEFNIAECGLEESN